jgi:hypothetical protein
VCRNGDRRNAKIPTDRSPATISLRGSCVLRRQRFAQTETRLSSNLGFPSKSYSFLYFPDPASCWRWLRTICFGALRDNRSDSRRREDRARGRAGRPIGIPPSDSINRLRAPSKSVACLAASSSIKPTVPAVSTQPGETPKTQMPFRADLLRESAAVIRECGLRCSLQPDAIAATVAYTRALAD